MSINNLVNHCRENLSCKKNIWNAAGGCVAGRFFGIAPLRGAVCGIVRHTAMYTAGLVSVFIFSEIYNQMSFLAKEKKANRVISLVSLTGNCLETAIVISLLGRQILASTVLGFIFASKGIALIGNWVFD